MKRKKQPDKPADETAQLIAEIHAAFKPHNPDVVCQSSESPEARACGSALQLLAVRNRSAVLPAGLLPPL